LREYLELFYSPTTLSFGPPVYVNHILPYEICTITSLNKEDWASQLHLKQMPPKGDT